MDRSRAVGPGPIHRATFSTISHLDGCRWGRAVLPGRLRLEPHRTASTVHFPVTGGTPGRGSHAFLARPDLHGPRLGAGAKHCETHAVAPRHALLFRRGARLLHDLVSARSGLAQ